MYIIMKMFLWDGRRKQIHPEIQGYEKKRAKLAMF